MVALKNKPIELSPLSNQEAEQARKSGQAIADFINDDSRLNLTLCRSDSQTLEVSIPTFALQLLAQVLDQMAQGNPVELIPHHAELTTHKAAEILNVSRPYLIQQLEAGKIPFRKVGTHRRIRHEDLIAYQEREREERHRGLDELVALSEEMGLYDTEKK